MVHTSRCCRRCVVNTVRDADSAVCLVLVPLRALWTVPVDCVPTTSVVLTHVEAAAVTLVLHVTKDGGDGGTTQTCG